jgi:hypothetical protein
MAPTKMVGISVASALGLCTIVVGILHAMPATARARHALTVHGKKKKKTSPATNHTVQGGTVQRRYQNGTAKTTQPLMVVMEEKVDGWTPNDVAAQVASVQATRCLRTKKPCIRSVPKLLVAMD